MSTNDPFRILNGETRTNEKFYVEFYRIKENVSNVLGRQVYNISPPSISFDIMSVSQGRNTYVDKGKHKVSPIQVTFKDDGESLIETILTVQVLRQLNNVRYPEPNGRDYKFDLKLIKYNSKSKPTVTILMKDCILTEVQPDPYSYADGEKSFIKCSIDFDRLEYEFDADYVEVLDIDEPKYSLPRNR